MPDEVTIPTAAPTGAATPAQPPISPNNVAYGLTKQAGKVVTILAGIIALGVLASVTLHIVMLEQKVRLPLHGAELLAACPEHACTTEQFQMMLEQDAQAIRTDRVRRALNARLMIFIVAEIVALNLVALGGVLIFDRIEAGQKQVFSSRWMQISSTFPGVLLCAMGTGVLILAIWLTTQPNSRETVWDYPIFFKDPNTMRNLWGVRAGHAPGSYGPNQADAKAQQASGFLKSLEFKLEDLEAPK